MPSKPHPEARGRHVQAYTSPFLSGMGRGRVIIADGPIRFHRVGRGRWRAILDADAADRYTERKEEAKSYPDMELVGPH